jgi:hypothetical protein
MPEQQWEYCEIGLVEWKKHEKGLLGGGKEGWSYNCYIRYYNSSGGIYYKLADTDKLISFNPFDKALSLLGSNGWELVSVQFGNRNESGSEYHDSGYIRWDNRVAYLKRPILPGRSVDEPKLVL